MPRATPSSIETSTIPTTNATLSFVPNRRTAMSFSAAAKRSMNSVPIAETNDGPEPAIPQTNSATPRATPAATNPAIPPASRLRRGAPATSGCSLERGTAEVIAIAPACLSMLDE